MAGEDQGTQQSQDPPSNEPEWLTRILQSHEGRDKVLQSFLSELITTLKADKAGNKPIAQLEDVCPIKPEDIYEFKPSDSQDDCEYFLFIERIKDYVAQYSEERVRPSLVSCLKNSRAKQWYASLSDEDKRKLRTSTTEWKGMLERDFGIKSARARFLAANETFSFAQNRPILQYFEAKLTWLKISGISDQNVLAIEIREGLQDPEYRAAVRLPVEAELAWLRSELVDTETDSKALWLKHSRPQRPIPSMPTRLPPVQPFYQPPNPLAAPHQAQQLPMRGRGRGFRGQFGTGGFRGRNRYQGPSTRREMPPPSTASTPRLSAQGERLAITAGEAIAPPRPCRFCGGNHWDRECTRFPPPTVPTFYSYDQTELSEESYYYDETQYEAMQTAAYNVSIYHHQEEDDYYHYPEDEVTENVHKMTLKPPSDKPQRSRPLERKRSTSPLPPSRTPYSEPAPPSAEISTTSSEDRGGAHFVSLTYAPTPDTCKLCNVKFPSRNALFAHLNKTGHFLQYQNRVPGIIVDSRAPAKNVGTGVAFRDYNYCEIRYQFSVDGQSSWGCADTGSGMSMIDASIFETIASEYQKFPNEPIRIKGIGEEVHTSQESVILEVLLPDISGQRFARI